MIKASILDNPRGQRDGKLQVAAQVWVTNGSVLTKDRRAERVHLIRLMRNWAGVSSWGGEKMFLRAYYSTG